MFLNILLLLRKLLVLLLGIYILLIHFQSKINLHHAAYNNVTYAVQHHNIDEFIALTIIVLLAERMVAWLLLVLWFIGYF